MEGETENDDDNDDDDDERDKAFSRRLYIRNDGLLATDEKDIFYFAPSVYITLTVCAT